MFSTTSRMLCVRKVEIQDLVPPTAPDFSGVRTGWQIGLIKTPNENNEQPQQVTTFDAGEAAVYEVGLTYDITVNVEAVATGAAE